MYMYLKVVWLASEISLRTSNLESAGLSTTSVKFSLKFCPNFAEIKQLTDTQKIRHLENLNLGNPTEKMTRQSHTSITNNVKYGCFKLFQQDAHLWLGNSVTGCIILMPVVGCFEAQSAFHFPNNVSLKFYLITVVTCFMCDLAMSSGERDSLNISFPYLLCYASASCNISAMAGQNLMKVSH